MIVGHQATTLQYLVGFGMLYLYFWSSEARYLMRSIYSDWLYRPSYGVFALPFVIGSFA
jgi:hypothetical protein